MNTAILTTEVQDYINKNLQQDVHKILLKKSPFTHVDARELVAQIESKLKSKKKLPTWFSCQNIYYPNKLNLSQTSSETTANYKAGLVSGKKLVDLTAGFGVDSAAFSKNISEVTHIEKNDVLSRIARHNYRQLGITNVRCIATDGIDFLKKENTSFDWIYVDPSRRDQKNNKVFYLSDCAPDVTEHLDLLFSKAPNILIKTGPLLDIQAGLSQLQNVKEIHVVAVSNEVKEVLWLLTKGFKEHPELKTINYTTKGVDNFSFYPHEEKTIAPIYGLPEIYLYEPNAAILKAGAFKSIGTQYNLKKLHPNSHLYTATAKVNFPGRVFKIHTIIEYNKKAFKKIGITKANITTRNFPDTVAEVRKKIGLKDGGENYLFCTTNCNEKHILLHCSKAF